MALTTIFGERTGPFPVLNSTLSFWRTRPHDLEHHRTTDDLPSQCDILIIGAGFSGASVAYHLLDSNPSPPSMVILEARSACSGATGRNGGHVKPDVYYRVPQYTRMFGKQAARDIAMFEAKQVYAVKQLVEKENIDCDFNLTRAYDVIIDARLAERCKKEFDQLVAEGFPTVKDVCYLPGPAAEALSGVKGAKCAFSFTAGSLWPYKLVTHLLSMAVQRGVNLQTNTPVLMVSEAQDADGNWVVSTPRGQLKARKIVFAANGYTAGILPQYQEKIIPVRGICSRVTVPEGKIAPSLPYSYSIRHSVKGADYQISRPDGSIIVGGGRPFYLHKGDEWYNVYDDSKLIEPAVQYFDGLMQRTYHGWENSGAKVDRIWTGIMGYTNDLMPHVGAVPSKDGQYISVGFNGHGMPSILLASKAVARMLREGCSFEETGVPAPFKTTPARLSNPSNLVLDLLRQQEV
ncbi:FAD dependent oxidoreductase superfamily protein [Pleurostoma richardsiae]|uniref:FAD dependent oxidoreductase superfamily protein n=1 Tax=Pleurostoma richardsiae TaxID=41990 RepID=A0AA38VB54_9PEZI|nr:FAD dependent oxidoreductase superfamily protein [Pleurostoma richardsiae]